MSAYLPAVDAGAVGACGRSRSVRTASRDEVAAHLGLDRGAASGPAVTVPRADRGSVDCVAVGAWAGRDALVIPPRAGGCARVAGGGAPRLRPRLPWRHHPPVDAGIARPARPPRTCSPCRTIAPGTSVSSPAGRVADRGLRKPARPRSPTSRSCRRRRSSTSSPRAAALPGVRAGTRGDVERLIEATAGRRRRAYRDRRMAHGSRCPRWGRRGRAVLTGGSSPASGSGPRPADDLLWFRLPRRPEDGPRPTSTCSSAPPNVWLLGRPEEWPVGYSLPKGGFAAVRAAGVEAIRRFLARARPGWLADRAHLWATSTRRRCCRSRSRGWPGGTGRGCCSSGTRPT